MNTLRLRISAKVYDKLIWLLSKFNKEEVEVISLSEGFTENKKILNRNCVK